MSYLTLFATSYFLDDNCASDTVDELAIYADAWGRSTIDCRVYWSRGRIMRRIHKDYNGIWGNNSKHASSNIGNLLLNNHCSLK